MAYVKLAKLKYDRPTGGLLQHIIAYELMIEDDVLIMYDDKGMLWNWPDDEPIEPFIDDEEHFEWIRELHGGEDGAEV